MPTEHTHISWPREQRAYTRVEERCERVGSCEKHLAIVLFQGTVFVVVVVFVNIVVQPLMSLQETTNHLETKVVVVSLLVSKKLQFVCISLGMESVIHHPHDAWPETTAPFLRCLCVAQVPMAFASTDVARRMSVVNR